MEARSDLITWLQQYLSISKSSKPDGPMVLKSKIKIIRRIRRSKLGIYQPQRHFHQIMVLPLLVRLGSLYFCLHKPFTSQSWPSSWRSEPSSSLFTRKSAMFFPFYQVPSPLSFIGLVVMPLTSLNGALWLIGKKQAERPPVRLDDAQQGQQQGGLPSTGATYNTWRPFRRPFSLPSIPFSTLFCVHDLFKTKLWL